MIPSACKPTVFVHEDRSIKALQGLRERENNRANERAPRERERERACWGEIERGEREGEKDEKNCNCLIDHLAIF